MRPVKESRSMWGLMWLEQLAQDVRYACRMLAVNPGFASIAVLSLAIGIGANSAIFSFADALLLRPLPVARPGQVLAIGSTTNLEALGASALISSYRDYVDIRDRSKSFEGLAAFREVTAGFAADPKATKRDQRRAVPRLRGIDGAAGQTSIHWLLPLARRGDARRRLIEQSLGISSIIRLT